MEPQPVVSPRPEPFTAQTPIDADAYFAAQEVLRRLQREFEGEMAIRIGRGQSRRAAFLARALMHGKRLTRALAPLAGIAEL
jgi:hypothetical protein